MVGESKDPLPPAAPKKERLRPTSASACITGKLADVLGKFFRAIIRMKSRPTGADANKTPHHSIAIGSTMRRLTPYSAIPSINTGKKLIKIDFSLFFMISAICTALGGPTPWHSPKPISNHRHRSEKPDRAPLVS